MATASLKHGAHKLLGHTKPAASDSPPIDNAKCEQEKQNISDHCENARPLPPDQIATSPRNKELATSSKNLRIQDFELIKTLGTGERSSNDDKRRHNGHPDLCTGTFARVWLACLAGSSHNPSECKVFALKILRKCDSKRTHKHAWMELRKQRD